MASAGCLAVFFVVALKRYQWIQMHGWSCRAIYKSQRLKQAGYRHRHNHDNEAAQSLRSLRHKSIQVDHQAGARGN
jgi:hypothetical protein